MWVRVLRQPFTLVQFECRMAFLRRIGHNTRGKNPRLDTNVVLAYLLPQNPDFVLIMLFFTTTYAFKTGFTRTNPHIPILYEINQTEKCILRFFLLPECNSIIPAYSRTFLIISSIYTPKQFCHNPSIQIYPYVMKMQPLF